MYLKSLEIQGFKSFPTHTRLTFDKPITAIVGPNGSGKSNIADAVLWVMGEQSTKTLRGGKMEDIIFGGTLRRPGQNFAEVSLILDNSEGNFNIDTSEVMLTRRYYRSGDSEYYINQSMVRLKDITELLMDTGLGNEGYCVIGQGRISDILSAKSRDRREIFEEAAGISRYRHKKEEAERKLSGTEENLVRIGDRISELELQIEPLREQAETARRYNLLTGELRGIEISLWLKELETISARTEKAENDHLAAVRELDAATVEADELDNESKALSNETIESEIEAQKTRELISEIEKEKGETDTEVSVLQSRLEGNAGQIVNLKDSLKSHDEQHDGVGMEISGNETRLQEVSRQKNEKNKQIAMLDKELEDVISNSGESEEKHRQLIIKEKNLLEELSENKSGLSALSAGAQELYDTDESLKQKLAAAKDDLKAREEENNLHNKELEQAREQAVSLQNIINGLTLKAESRSKKAEASKETFSRLSSEYETLITRHKLLTDWEKEYQGYSNSVKTVMQEGARGTLKNIHGTVGSLVKTDERYAIAVETALGGTLQHIIVNTEEDGKAAINLLKRRGGTATFQPISTVKGTALSDKEFAGLEGYIDLAVNLVKFDAEYSGIYTYLLGRVIVCEDLTSAIQIARRHGHRYKTVTLDGQVMNVGGSMTGGSARREVGVLSRANELEGLKKRIDSCKQELEKAEREHSERVREMNAALYERDTAAEQLRMAAEDVKMRELEKSHREANINAAVILIDNLNLELGSIESRIKQNSADTKILQEKIRQTETKLTALGEEITEAIAGNEKLEKERSRIEAGRSELRAEISALDAEKDALTQAVTTLRTLAEEISGNRQMQLDTIKKLETENEEIRAGILQGQRSAGRLEERIDTLRQSLRTIDARKLEIEAKRTEISAAIKSKFDLNIEKQRKVSRLETKLEEIRGDERLIVDRLWSTYELSRSAAVNHATPIESPAAARKRINSIKRELDDLGIPNLGAIKEYERVSERYNDYTTQRDDVEKAKTELLGIIEDITERMREIFIREFDLINESFKHTFKELFGGGQACLILEDTEDVLGCGIEIEAMPPGKVLKSTAPLSGGEKTLVAIAIYFAILSVRPPPFVIMDEIDATLDDANVIRFSSYMRHMSEKTQMIAITHRRGTMEEADVLYGITMQELGVSNILSIDLDEAEKHISKISA